MKHHRAMDEGEKNERRRLILQQAGALFETAAYDQVSMLDVAHQAGLAKGTLYLYFHTKEELFLALMDDAFAGWFAELQQRLTNLAGGEGRLRIAPFTVALTTSLQQHPRLLRLLPILHTVLEHNVPYPSALEFKRHLRHHLLQTGLQIEGGLAFLQAGQGAELLLSAYAGLIGLQSMARPSEVMRQVLELPEMAVLVLDESAALRLMVERLLSAIYYENKRETQ